MIFCIAIWRAGQHDTVPRHASSLPSCVGPVDSLPPRPDSVSRVTEHTLRGTSCLSVHQTLGLGSMPAVAITPVFALGNQGGPGSKVRWDALLANHSYLSLGTNPTDIAVITAVRFDGALMAFSGRADCWASSRQGGSAL